MDREQTFIGSGRENCPNQVACRGQKFAAGVADDGSFRAQSDSHAPAEAMPAVASSAPVEPAQDEKKSSGPATAEAARLAEQQEPPRQMLDDYQAGALATQFEDKEPEELLEWAFAKFHPRIAIVSSFQVDSMVLIDMAYQINKQVRVVTVDTGRLPQETYDLIDQICEKYGIEIEVLFPDTHHVESMVRRHGLNSFRKSVPMRLLCCHVRKVAPIQRMLRTLDAWITGLRRDQWATRANIRKVEIDHDHGGLVKLNPLADWTHEDVWDYVRHFNVPYHKLYDQGYASIGCDPCTRAIKPGEDPRAGRWWWEVNAPKECGMHCPIETGGFEHEFKAILGDADHTEGSGI